MAKRSWERSHLVHHFFPSQGQAGPGWGPALLSLAQLEQKGCAELSQLIAGLVVALAVAELHNPQVDEWLFQQHSLLSLGLWCCWVLGEEQGCRWKGHHEWHQGSVLGALLVAESQGNGSTPLVLEAFPCVFPSSSWGWPLG